MNDDLIIELYRSKLAAANEEKGILYSQVNALTEEVSMLRLSVDDLLSGIKVLSSKLEDKEKLNVNLK